MKRLIRITSGDDFLPPCRLPQPPEEERLWRGSEGHLSWWDDEGGAQGRQVERRQEAWLAGCERILGVWRLQLLPCVRVSACIRDSHILAGTSDPSRFLMFIRVVLFHSSCVLFYFFFFECRCPERKRVMASGTRSRHSRLTHCIPVGGALLGGDRGYAMVSPPVSPMASLVCSLLFLRILLLSPSRVRVHVLFPLEWSS